MLFPATQRYHPRQPQDREQKRREAAFRAELSDLGSRLLALEQEQRIQLLRTSQIQQQLDELAKLVLQLTNR